jgi:hypothetical protein
MVIGSSLFSIGGAEAQPQQDATPAQQPDKIVATQDTTPAAATPPTTPAEPTWSAGPIEFSGLVDGYYDTNFNHPSTMDNQLRNFDEKANQFNLNMMKVTMQHDPDPVGFRVDLGFGRAFTTIHASEQAPQIFQYLEQAYVSLKPPKAKGFEADFGEFVTSAGAEVIETKDNWNYSRSLLFAWAIPYYHFGLRTSMPLTKTITGGVQVVNGWNDVEDNNSGKTIGVTGVLTKPKYALNVNYYVGPEKPNTNKGYRNLIDGVLWLYPTSKVGIYLNYDYAQERSLTNVLDHYQGFAGAARFQLTKTIAVAPRAEIFNDPQGFSTGTPQQLEEFTITGEYKIAEGFLSRLEYRRDHSDQFFFQRGTTPNGSQNQSTFLVGMVVYYGPKR